MRGRLQDTEARLASVKRRCRQNANFPKYIELFTPPRQVKSEKFARFDDAKSHQFMGFGQRANFSPLKSSRGQTQPRHAGLNLPVKKGVI